MNHIREFHAVGIVTDEATLEVFVVVTGGTDTKTTEILLGDVWSIGKKE